MNEILSAIALLTSICLLMRLLAATPRLIALAVVHCVDAVLRRRQERSMAALAALSELHREDRWQRPSRYERAAMHRALRHALRRTELCSMFPTHTSG